MSSGSFNLEVPHFCGELIEVEVKWFYAPATYDNPPDGDEEWNYPNNCPKCGVALVYDELFMANIEQKLKQNQKLYADSEYVDGDDVDFGPLEEPY